MAILNCVIFKCNYNDVIECRLRFSRMRAVFRLSFSRDFSPGYFSIGPRKTETATETYTNNNHSLYGIVAYGFFIFFLCFLRRVHREPTGRPTLGTCRTRNTY